MKIVRTLLITAIAAAAVLVGAASPAAARDAVTFRTGQLLQFDQVAGNPSSKDRAAQRVRNAQWQFGGGQFVFHTTDVRTDLYPLAGSYTVDGNTVRFSASRTATFTTGSAYAEISGELDATTGRLSFRWLSSAGNGAVVNGTAFTGASSSGYTGVVTVS
ncbi:hypothetical protein AB0M02_06465 [Actinoplanes sp. NPDC051861]|uniref:hypothetical protein n=1 Tax=Actinoplanes sp. NPDC051861 TaxID=3155170 RepID=UPI00343D6C4A